ncbi:MAG TPA: LutB/LldF family L-lactate oxidation iron-sulfur protein [Anaerolineales bacterium]|nr:LutB/LldF family L-lactate oxidation iron-sulfur protein [Anaerolineales bacterium]
MSHQVPTYIGFEEYSEHVPASIPSAVQQATDRFVSGRAARVAELPEWEQLRQIGSDIRLHTIENMDMYLTQLEEKVKAAGGHVHWAETAEDANRIVLELAKEHNVKTAVKSKSMATEEIGLNHALERAGIQAVETDLGEYIIQLAGTGPSHIIVPAVHLKKEEIAALFSEKLDIHAPTDPMELARIAREVLREKFLQAEMGISGGNFLVAETGTLVLVTNEGNGRMCTTIPDVHVAVVGIDKVIPDWESLTVFLKLLARSATGQKLSTYTQFITGPRRAEGEFGPKEFHLVLLDNGRSNVLQDPVGREVFKCIRCGACANVCPVYKNVGGFAYGSFISGPIGAILSPQMLGTQAARELPFASTLCGACADVCPVKIPIPTILRHLRRRVSQGDQFAEPTLPAPIRMAASLASLVLSQNWIYRLGTRLLPSMMSIFERGGWIPSAPYPLSRWTRARPLPLFTAGFRSWWKNVRHAEQKASTE